MLVWTDKRGLIIARLINSRLGWRSQRDSFLCDCRPDASLPATSTARSRSHDDAPLVEPHSLLAPSLPSSANGTFSTSISWALAAQILRLSNEALSGGRPGINLRALGRMEDRKMGGEEESQQEETEIMAGV